MVFNDLRYSVLTASNRDAIHKGKVFIYAKYIIANEKPEERLKERRVGFSINEF